jgi:mitochondrial enoyl-[acyl-carrier protein] reductase / trans-2-enoyl-CoA reductase
VDELKALGGDIVLVDGPDLAKRVMQATNKAEIMVGFDAVAGTATGRMADCLARNGRLVNYGAISNEPLTLTAGPTIFKNITIGGFWLVTWMKETAPADVAKAYAAIVPMLASGEIKIPIAATYTLADYKKAYTHAVSERDGKILFTPSA